MEVWMLREKFGGKVRVWRGAGQYLADCTLAFGVSGEVSGKRQWRAFHRMSNMGGRAFRRSQHAVVFEALGVEVFGQVRMRMEAA